FVTTALPYTSIWYDDVLVGNQSIGFVTRNTSYDELVTLENCYTYNWSWSPCQGQEGCTYTTGNQVCTKIDDGSTLDYCTGGFAQCTDHVGAESTCVQLAQAPANAYHYCYADEGERLRPKASLQLVNLSNPSAPQV